MDLIEEHGHVNGRLASRPYGYGGQYGPRQAGAVAQDMKDQDVLRNRGGEVSWACGRWCSAGRAAGRAVGQAAPSRTAELRGSRRAGRGLVPSIDYFRLTVEARERQRHRPLAIIAGIAIGSDGPSGSARLFCRRDWPFIPSRGGGPPTVTRAVALVRLLLKEVYGCKPHYRLPRPHPEGIDQESDALDARRRPGVGRTRSPVAARCWTWGRRGGATPDNRSSTRSGRRGRRKSWGNWRRSWRRPRSAGWRRGTRSPAEARRNWPSLSSGRGLPLREPALRAWSGRAGRAGRLLSLGGE